MNPTNIADKLVDAALFNDMAQKMDWGKRWAAATRWAEWYINPLPTTEQIQGVILDVDKIELERVSKEELAVKLFGKEASKLLPEMPE